MLQIQLGQYREVDPSTDALGRDHIGYRPGMTEQEAWTACLWGHPGASKVDRALEQDEVKIVNLDGIVLAVADILWDRQDQGAGLVCHR